MEQTSEASPSPGCIVPSVPRDEPSTLSFGVFGKGQPMIQIATRSGKMLASLECDQLSHANLSRASLIEAGFHKSDLTGAYLKGANLEVANFSGSFSGGGRWFR